MTDEIVLPILSSSAVSAAAMLLVNRLLDWLRRRRHAHGYLVGIQLEIAYAQECADEYVTRSENGKKLWAPGYRTVTDLTCKGVAWLKTEGFVTDDEANQLFRFHTRAMELNRSLDLLGTLTAKDNFDQGRALAETSRAYVKSKNLLGNQPSQRVGSTPEAWEAAARALRRMSRPWIARAPVTTSLPKTAKL